MTRKAGTRGTIGFSGSAGAAPNLAVGSGSEGNPSQTSALLALISPLSEMNVQNYRTKAVILFPVQRSCWSCLVLLKRDPRTLNPKHRNQTAHREDGVECQSATVRGCLSTCGNGQKCPKIKHMVTVL